MSLFTRLANAYRRYGVVGATLRGMARLLNRARARALLVVYKLTGGRVARFPAFCVLENDPYLVGLLGMTSPSERAFLQWYARELYTGQGLIVDLGPFLGATTCSLARGLSANQRIGSRSGRVRVFDQFVCDAYMSNLLSRYLSQGLIEHSYQEGASFRFEFEKQTQDFADMFILREGDLSELDTQIQDTEFLFIDAMKDVATANHIVRHFYPHLIPGLSLVVHQDFAHFYTGWIHLIQYELREYLEPVYFIPKSSSQVYRVKKDPSEIRHYRLDLSEWDEPRLDAAFRYSLSMVPPKQRASVIAAKFMLYIHRGDKSGARRRLAEYVEAGHPLEGDLPHVASLVGFQGGS
jgi:hypothetical protein